MSIKEDMNGTNAYSWDRKQRGQYLEAVDTTPTPDIDNLITECPYHFVCECVTKKSYTLASKDDSWWERQGYAEKMNVRLRAELEERRQLEYEYWHYLLERDTEAAQILAEMVLVSNV